MVDTITVYAISIYDNAVLDIATINRGELRDWQSKHPIVLGWEVEWMVYEDAIYYAYIA